MILDPIPLPYNSDLISFLANWNCVYKGLVLKMVLSTSGSHYLLHNINKVYKYNLEDGLSFDSIDNKQIKVKEKACFRCFGKFR